MKILEIKNPVYTDCTHKTINCDILFEEIGEFVPYSACTDDPSTVDIYQQCADMISTDTDDAGEVDPALVQQYETEQYNMQQQIQRESAYKLECDPLTLESIVKRSMGLDTDADALLVQSVQRRIEIQTRYQYK